MGRGPLGSGMEETYQINPLSNIYAGAKTWPSLPTLVSRGSAPAPALVTLDPKPLPMDPWGKCRMVIKIQIIVDRNQLTGRVDLVGDGTNAWTPEQAQQILRRRSPRPDLSPACEVTARDSVVGRTAQAGGGTWGGCVIHRRDCCALDPLSRREGLHRRQGWAGERHPNRDDATDQPNGGRNLAFFQVREDEEESERKTEQS